MKNKGEKISMIKSWICRTEQGKRRLTSLYKANTKAQNLKEKNYTYDY